MIAPVVLLLGAFVAQQTSAAIPWYQSSILYQVYPRSFADSDGDGNGDIKGIIAHVPYLKDIGVGVIWLSPIFASPMEDNGYDVSDYRNVNPLYGTMADLEELIKEVHNNGMKLFLDYVPNHTSDKHPWFNASRYQVDGKDDYYVWKDPKTSFGSDPQPPNNWLSIFGGPAWTYDEVRKKFYLHQFGTYQPDLNYRNPAVMKEMQDTMKFWFDKGIDGFRVDAVPYLVEDDRFLDEPEVPNCKSQLPSDCLNHIYTENTPENYQALKDFDDFLTQYDNTTTPKYFFSEAYATQAQTMKYYQKHTSPFNFVLISSLRLDTNATELKSVIDSYMANLPQGAWPNWVLGNHDNSRIASKMGPEMIDAITMMNLMLPGASVTYYGDEIGMEDNYIRKSEAVDKSTPSRDPERTPMQWNQSKNAGFSRADKTWLPVHPNYYKLNVAAEKNASTSHLSKYKRLGEVRKNFVESTDLETVTLGDWVFAFKRTYNKNEYYVIINLNNVEEDVVLNDGFSKISPTLYVHTTSDNSQLQIGDKISTKSKITLQPRSALGLSSASSFGLAFSLFVLTAALWCVIFGKQ